MKKCESCEHLLRAREPYNNKKIVFCDLLYVEAKEDVDLSQFSCCNYIGEEADTVFVVMAYRYKSRDGHSYIVGVFSDLEAAQQSAIDEEMFRGGKYGCIVHKTKLDSGTIVEEYKTDFFSSTDADFPEQTYTRKQK